ncbi:putative reverse transcriptase domain-containing protein [Tanacetum coccineum]
MALDEHSSGTGVRGSERVARECTYQDFMKCEPLYFKGTEGVVELTQWFERMETKKMTDKYCPRNEMKKLEAELWNLKVCRWIADMIMEENRGFKAKDNARGYWKMATELWESESVPLLRDKAKNKRKFETRPELTGTNTTKQNKETITAGHTLGSGDKKIWWDLDPYAQNAITTMMVRVLQSAINVTNMVTSLGAQGHFKKIFSKRNVKTERKNNKGNRGNQAGNDRAPAKVYVVGNAGANPDNVVAGTFLLNNRYAYILFDTGADRSFVSTTFSSQIDITPSTLDHYYDVELADGRIIGLNTILKGCTLNFLNHQFNINLMPVELGSFDAIIGMDWLAKYQAVIMCAEKIVRIPWKNKTLIIHGDGSTQGNVTRLNIISCTKTQRYMEKGFPIFLAHVTTKRLKNKSEKKRLEGSFTHSLRTCLKYFLKTCRVCPPDSTVEFQIDFVPGAAPVARGTLSIGASENE